jgi:hypothetical protein
VGDDGWPAVAAGLLALAGAMYALAWLFGGPATFPDP